MQPLTILHTASSCSWNGQEDRILSEAKGMIERGHQVGLFCPPLSQLFERAREMQIDAFPAPFEKRNHEGFKAAFKWMKRYRVDVVNTHNALDNWYFSTSKIMLRKQCHLIRTLHKPTLLSRDPATHLLFRYGSSRIITTSETVRHALVDRNKLPSDKVYSIPTGIDLDHFDRGNQLRARNDVNMPVNIALLGVSGDHLLNINYDALLSTISQLPEDYFLAILGDSVSLPDVKEKVRSMDLEHRVHFVSHANNKLQWLQALDLFIHPASPKTAVPLTMLQAMACEVPVVSTKTKTVSEVISDGETGLLVPPDDSKALTVAIETLFSNSKLYRHLAIQGYHYARENFDLAIMLDSTESLYEEIFD